MTVIFEVGSFTNQSGTGTQTVSLDSGRWGSESPKAIIAWSHWNATTDSALTFSVLSFSVWTADDQGCISILDRDNQGTTDSTRIFYNNKILAYYDGNDVLRQMATYSSFGAAEFTVNWSDNDLGSGRNIGFMAIGGTDVQVSLDFITSPTSDSEVSYTGPGFEPDWLLNFTNSSGAANSLLTHNLFGIGTADSSTQGGSSGFSQDALGTSKTGRRQTANFCTTYWNDAIRETGNLTSLDATGYTIDWTDTISTAVDHAVLAVKGPQVKVIAGTQPATDTTVNRDAGFPPIAAFLHSIGGTASYAGANQIFAMGAWDDDNNQQGLSIASEDNQATSDTERWADTGSALTQMNINASNLGQATLSASGNNVVETWTDTDGGLREHYITIFGDVAGGDVDGMLGLSSIEHGKAGLMQGLHSIESGMM